MKTSPTTPAAGAGAKPPGSGRAPAIAAHEKFAADLRRRAEHPYRGLSQAYLALSNEAAKSVQRPPPATGRDARLTSWGISPRVVGWIIFWLIVASVALWMVWMLINVVQALCG